MTVVTDSYLLAVSHLPKAAQPVDPHTYGTSTMASRLNSSVYRFVYLLPTWCYLPFPSAASAIVRSVMRSHRAPADWQGTAREASAC
ncbi:hypothetical protein M2271_005107 [Streptomyces sp. LBL]|uniref:hypothetical protein n=1 Tax=Streptomyces sp. LBL TaxID=2940562 RepID=UPI002475AB32|nr:hypothetical protein [Streptomyces sp. LBL]MDH6627283.1 hypothetical protein [Streptomyces sp. LBL]